MVLRPTERVDFDFFVGVGEAGDALKRAVGQTFERRGMRLEGDGFVWMRSAEDARG